MRGASSMWPGRIATLAAAALVVALQLHPLDDTDTWWHLASGRWIATHGTVARTDPFSWSAPGAPWVNRQWLFDLGLWHAWTLGGAAAAIVVAATLFATAYALAWLLVRRHLPAWAAAALVTLAAQSGVERFVVRPEAASYALVALYLWVLDGRPRTGALAALVAVQALWANLHALSVLGVVVLGCATAGALVERWRRREAPALPLALATAGAALAETATPFGLEGALFPLRLLTVIRGGEVTSLAVIEHRPAALGELSPPVAAAFVALLALAVVALVVGRRRLDARRVLWAAAFVALGLMARRNVGLVGLGALPLIADGLAPLVATLERRRPLALGAAALTTLVCVAGTVQVVRGAYYDDALLTRRFGLGTSALLFPPGAAAYLAAHPPGRLFNDDVLGGFLLWHDPDRPVFIDGRLQVYPPEVFRIFHQALSDVRVLQGLAERTGVDTVALYHPAPGRLELAVALARQPGWRVAYVDPGVVVLERGRGDAPVVGPTDPIPPQAGPIVAGVQTPTEEALLHYQRGRATLLLLGEPGRTAAAADFAAALRLRPDLADAAQGLRLATGRP